MKISEIRKGLESQLQTIIDNYNTANNTTIPVVYENSGIDLNSKDIWLRATLLPNTVQSVGVSKDSPNLYRGFFQVDAFTQKRIGSQKAVNLLTFIANDFKKGLTLNFLGIKIEIEQLSVLPSMEEENYFKLAMRIPWFSYVY